MTDTNSKAQVTDAALQAAADANGGYINGKTKRIVMAAINAVASRSPEAHRHSVALRQCSLFAADVGEHIVKAMVDAADFLDGPALAAQEKPEPGVAVAIRRAGLKARDELLERLADGGTVDNDLADYMSRIVEECIRAALVSTETQAPAIPDGWRLVPVEPTVDMVTDGRIIGWEFENCAHVSDYGDLFRRQWARALAAAPSPDLPEGEATDIIREMLRLADMGLDESLKEPEENGNFAIYERAKRFLPTSPSPIDKGEVN